MESEILSLQNISVVKCAILISLSPELKREILCVPGSEYDAYKLKYQYHRKEQWNAIVERKAKEILNHRELPENLKEKVISLLPSIALRMLIWAEYHEGTLGLTRYYSLNFLRNSHFTLKGLIDNKKAAEEMIKDVNLSIKQKYKLACIYCFISHIFTFFKEMVKYKKTLAFSHNSKWMEKPEIVKYWTLHIKNMVGECRKSTPRYRYRLEKFIKSGSKEAVKYSLAMTGLRYQENAHIYGVTEVLKKISLQSDWIVFSDLRFDDSKESWVPNYFYVDILCFLLSNMTEAQQKKALEKNIKGHETYTNENYTTVLEIFLCWPYQDYFMKTAVLLWDLMPQETYAGILYKICETIEPCKTVDLLYGEEKNYDYKKILKDFWTKSPDHFKRFVFTNNKHVDYWDGVEVTTKPPSIDLIFYLIAMKTFTYEDEEIISLILGSATIEEKANLTSAEWWRNHSNNVLLIERFEIFDRLLLVLCKSEEETREFKKKLDIFNIALSVCYYFLKYSKIKAVKSLINWMSLSECELLSIKTDIIYSRDGMQHCRKLLLSKMYKDFEECIKWFLPSTEKAIKYKRSLTFHLNETSHVDRFPVYHFDKKDILDFITRFTKSKLPNRNAMKGMQTSVIDIFGRTLCEDLIAGSSFQVIYEEKDSSVRIKNEFTGGQWERVNEFLRWSLSTEKKILEFKKSIFKVSGVGIHFQLIKVKQWKEAKRFFEWLGLSAKQIKNLKKRTLFYHDPCWKMFHYLVFEDDDMNNLETIDLFLRWNLTDKITVIEFRDVFSKAHERYDESGLKKFNTLIENYLDDLDQGERYRIRWNPEERFFMKLDAASSKRKSTVFSQQKKIRLSSGVEEELYDDNTGNCSRRRSQRLWNRANK